LVIGGRAGKAVTTTIAEGRRIYSNALTATQSRRRCPIDLQRGMQRPSDSVGSLNMGDSPTQARTGVFYSRIEQGIIQLFSAVQIILGVPYCVSLKLPAKQNLPAALPEERQQLKTTFRCRAIRSHLKCLSFFRFSNY
jgi:hypothetical protein